MRYMSKASLQLAYRCQQESLCVGAGPIARNQVVVLHDPSEPSRHQSPQSWPYKGHYVCLSSERELSLRKLVVHAQKHMSISSHKRTVLLAGSAKAK